MSPAVGFLDGVLIPAGHAVQIDPCRDVGLEVPSSQFRKDFRHIVS